MAGLPNAKPPNGEADAGAAALPELAGAAPKLGVADDDPKENPPDEPAVGGAGAGAGAACNVSLRGIP